MSTFLNSISIIMIIAGIKFQNSDLFWVAGMFAILGLIFAIYHFYDDEMPEPAQKFTKSYTVMKAAKERGLPVIDFPLVETNPSDMSGLPELK